MQYRIKLIALLCLLAKCYLPVQAQPQPRKKTGDKIIAVVGDHIILASEIQNSIDDLTRQGEQLPPNVACVATEKAIISKMLMLQALQDSLPVSDEDVEAELDRRLSYFINQQGGEMDDKAVRKIKEEARAQLKEYMLATAMQEKIVAPIKITPAEVRSFFERIPTDSLPLLEPEMEVGQVIFYPAASKDLQQYVINEMNNYKKQVESKIISFCQLEKLSDSKDACSEYKINRNSSYWDPEFLSAAFHLKSGEISAPVKCKYGFYLIQMMDRQGDNATVRSIFRSNPVSDLEINQARSELNLLRTSIMEGRIGFNEAASKYSEDKNVNISGSFFLNWDGSPYLTSDQLEKEVADIVAKMTVGEISYPLLYVDAQNKKGVRLIYLKSRSTAHRMNLRDDYSKLSKMALEEKKNRVLDKWLRVKTSIFSITVDEETAAGCPLVQKYASTGN